MQIEEEKGDGFRVLERFTPHPSDRGPLADGRR